MKIVNATFFMGNLLAKVDKEIEENFRILKDIGTEVTMILPEGKRK